MDIDEVELPVPQARPTVVVTAPMAAPNLVDPLTTRLQQWQQGIDLFTLFNGLSKPGSATDATQKAWLRVYKPGVKQKETARDAPISAPLEPQLTISEKSVVEGIKAPQHIYIVEFRATAADEAPTFVIFSSVHSAFRFALSNTFKKPVVVRAYSVGGNAVLDGGCTLVVVDDFVNGQLVGTKIVSHLNVRSLNDALLRKKGKEASNEDALNKLLPEITAVCFVPPGFFDFKNKDKRANLKKFTEQNDVAYRAVWSLPVPHALRKDFATHYRGSIGNLFDAMQQGRILTRNPSTSPNMSTTQLWITPQSPLHRPYVYDVGLRHIGSILQMNWARDKRIGVSIMPYHRVTPVEDLLSTRFIENVEKGKLKVLDPAQKGDAVRQLDSYEKGSRSLRYLMARAFGETEQRLFFLVHRASTIEQARPGYMEVRNTDNPALAAPPTFQPYAAVDTDHVYAPLAYVSLHTLALHENPTEPKVYLFSVGDSFVGPMLEREKLSELLEDLDKLQAQKDEMVQTQDRELDKYLRNPETAHLVTNRLIALARAFATYLDGTGAKFYAMLGTKCMQPFFDALALNASKYTRGAADNTQHQMEFQQLKTQTNEKKIDHLATDDYLETFGQFTISERAPQQLNNLFISQDDSSQSLTEAVRRREESADLMEEDQASSAVSSPIRPGSPAKLVKTPEKVAPTAEPPPKQGGKKVRPAKRSLTELYGDDDAETNLPVADDNPAAREPLELPSPSVPREKVAEKATSTVSPPEGEEEEGSSEMDELELFAGAPVVPMERYLAQLETMRANLYDSDRARKAQRTTDALLESPGSSGSRASSSSSSPSSSASDKTPKKKRKD